MSISTNLAHVVEEIRAAALAAGRDPAEITLVAATKTQSDDVIRQAIAAGVTVCGENRVQELTAHWEARAYEGAQVHFIGHLQTNKVKYLIGKVDLIHSVSSQKLLLEIDKQAGKAGLVQDILLEVNLAQELSKSGFFVPDVLPAAQLCGQLEHVRLRGLMCIPLLGLLTTSIAHVSGSAIASKCFLDTALLYALISSGFMLSQLSSSGNITLNPFLSSGALYSFIFFRNCMLPDITILLIMFASLFAKIIIR